jgi:hypothetical protein
MFDNNTYRKQSYSGPLVGWEGTDAASVSAMQSLWGFETGTSGSTGTTPSTPPPSTQQADTTAPVAKIISPSSGTTVGKTAKVSSSASDNVQVTKSELYIDGVRKATSSTGTLSYSWKPTDGSHTLVVKAYDAAGNAGQASVTVSR